MSHPSYPSLTDGIISVISRIDMVLYTCYSPGEALFPPPSYLSHEDNPSGLLQDVPTEPFVHYESHTHIPELGLFRYEFAPCWEYKQINEVGPVSVFFFMTFDTKVIDEDVLRGTREERKQDRGRRGWS